MPEWMPTYRMRYWIEANDRFMARAIDFHSLQIIWVITLAVTSWNHENIQEQMQSRLLNSEQIVGLKYDDASGNYGVYSPIIFKTAILLKNFWNVPDQLQSNSHVNLLSKKRYYQFNRDLFRNIRSNTRL